MLSRPGAVRVQVIWTFCVFLSFFQANKSDRKSYNRAWIRISACVSISLIQRVWAQAVVSFQREMKVNISCVLELYKSRELGGKRRNLELGSEFSSQLKTCARESGYFSLVDSHSFILTTVNGWRIGKWIKLKISYKKIEQKYLIPS